MRIEKKKFKKVFCVDEKHGQEVTTLEFPTESSGLIYEKLLDIENLLKGNIQEEKGLSEEEEKLLSKLLEKSKK